MTITHYTSKDAKFFQYLDKEIFVGDVLDPSNSGHMSAGYYRNKKKGEKNEWIVTYDEVLVVTRAPLRSVPPTEQKPPRQVKSSSSQRAPRLFMKRVKTIPRLFM
ncbi:MAG: hypothetical protein E5Y73_15710 [Mesorhizobium sp.]|uniref:hypothetical protein n=1 Tax=Mesorhizobium sp. TaxID=1871066 RepID=UPI0012203132|nr:hypothetical protein [Mesorhizobium sp.]TIL92263.1 MAG: hypothetical protein E5Y73_15710 [Mesorhizobium sp.]